MADSNFVIRKCTYKMHFISDCQLLYVSTSTQPPHPFAMDKAYVKFSCTIPSQNNVLHATLSRYQCRILSLFLVKGHNSNLLSKQHYYQKIIFIMQSIDH